VVTLTNTPDGEDRVREVYGDRVLVVPYVMPGFELASRIAGLTANVDWSALDGIVLMHHGVFSFANEARGSYESMIRLVDQAEKHLQENGATTVASNPRGGDIESHHLSRLREAVSIVAGRPMLVRVDDSAEAVGFSELADVKDIAGRGPLTPDHVIRTKRVPIIVGDDVDGAVAGYIDDYKRYFLNNTDGSLTCLDPAPRWGIWPGRGLLAFGTTVAETRAVADIARHTIRSIQWAEALGGWRTLPERDIFQVEYWELEQAKLRKSGQRPPLQGRIALVTGAASGIGRACVTALLERGATVVALDIDTMMSTEFGRPDVKTIQCDVTDAGGVSEAIAQSVNAFGGLDILISNAGSFPRSRHIEDMDDDTWNSSLEVNLTSHQHLLRYGVPFLKNGIDPAVVIVGSKNVPAPGPGASAYSTAKAGLTQLARVAALELGEHGIRVNTVHPNAVFDTAMWNDATLKSRAASYGLSVDAYKSNNVLKTEVTAADVATMICEMAGPAFSKTTGAQIPVDGGNERVI
jgi:NAD(P)-dependent dehydrogenase (short-subunit alcohol dehydrogenase family)